MNWHLDAACVGQDPLMWETQNMRQRAGANALAVSICKSCPVQAECLTEALEVEQGFAGRYHIYGGLLPEQRAKLDKGPRHPKRRDKVA